MKKLILLGVVILMGSQLKAQTDSTKAVENVDTEIRFGKVFVMIKGDDIDTIYRSGEISRKKYPNVQFLPTFDIGVSGYMKDFNGQSWTQGGGQIPVPVNTGSTELDFAKSRNFAFNGNLVFNLTKNFGIITGLGLNYNTYRFKENTTITPKEGTFMIDTVRSYSKYKFRNKYVQVPLMFKIQSSNEDFQFALGGIVGYNFSSKVKAEYTIDGGEYKTVIKDNFNVNPLKLSLGARFSYKGAGLYFNYGLTEMLSGVDKDLNGYNLMPFEAGITIGVF